MYCPNCGTEVGDRGKYCSKCGKTVKHSSSKKFIIIMTSLVAGIGVSAAIFLGTKAEPEVVTKEVKQEENVEQINTEPEQKPKQEAVPKKQDIIEPPKDVSDIIHASQPKVFTIFTDYGQGSGFLINKQGDVLTNAHVVEGSLNPIVKTIDGTEYQGDLIGYSNTTDIAVIRVPELANKEPLPLEEKVSAEIGDEVIALGSPQGFENTATLGNISGVDRTFVIDPFRYEGIYQTSAPIAPGSSGGPLLSKTTGEVLAINSARLTQEDNIGFSIPLYKIIETVHQWTNSPMSDDEMASLFYYEDGVYYYQDFMDENGYFEDGSYDEGYLDYYEFPYDDSWYDEYWYEEDYEEDYDYDDEYYDDSYDEYYDDSYEDEESYDDDFYYEEEESEEYLYEEDEYDDSYEEEYSEDEYEDEYDEEQEEFDVEEDPSIEEQEATPEISEEEEELVESETELEEEDY